MFLFVPNAAPPFPRSKLIDPELLARIERLTVGAGRVPNLHPFLRRGIFFSHRDLAAICDAAEVSGLGGRGGRDIKHSSVTLGG